jgi:ribonuclease HI
MSFYAEIYTDGSCHTQRLIGAWAAIVLINEHKTVLTGREKNTTHNRMEIMAVISSITHIIQNHKTINELKIVSDSQYVIGLISREAKFKLSDFKTKAGTDIRNIDLVKALLKLVSQMNITFVKIKAHQKPTDVVNYNIEVDKLCRQLLRESINEGY